MKSKPDAYQRNNQTATENNGKGKTDETVKSKLLPNEVKQNHRTGNNIDTSPVTLKEFLHNKLPRKTVSDRLVSSIKEKIKAFHLL
ncbi:hypothetical protein C7N43_23690 [Sphingobacteriales bacterium UPWRP_1]|nr:hypothetical protein BVG80_06660 [Sphingobacteriales bacterium TSM_CSM]PSJ74495.1 hypothetical protein C7N43_23690 [Sphingobacteriales bacterium UPWRP_1]